MVQKWGRWLHYKFHSTAMLQAAELSGIPTGRVAAPISVYILHVCLSIDDIRGTLTSRNISNSSYYQKELSSWDCGTVYILTIEIEHKKRKH